MATDRKQCANCGHNNPEAWIACANCGESLSPSSKTSNRSSSNSSANRSPSQPARRAQSASAPAPPTNYQGQNENSWSRGFDQAWGFGCGCISFVIVLFFILAWLGSPFPSAGGSSDGSSSSDYSMNVVITLDQYNRLYTGMSYSQAVAVMGSPGVESSRNEFAGYTTVAYSWQNPDGSNVIVMFQNDQLVQKTQAGLS